MHPSPCNVSIPRQADKDEGGKALFDNKPHMANALAVEETVVNAMSRDEFQKRLEGMDPVMRGVVNMMVERSREMAEELMHDE